MVLASLMHYSDRIRAGVDIVGISDFTTFLTNTESYRRDLRRAEYGDERTPRCRGVRRISPARHPLAISSRCSSPRARTIRACLTPRPSRS
jgi:dipeptidyl aminopeptidase/acylaminoacyl peptidase